MESSERAPGQFPGLGDVLLAQEIFAAVEGLVRSRDQPGEAQRAERIFEREVPRWNGHTAVIQLFAGLDQCEPRTVVDSGRDAHGLRRRRSPVLVLLRRQLSCAGERKRLRPECGPGEDSRQVDDPVKLQTDFR